MCSRTCINFCTIFFQFLVPLCSSNQGIEKVYACRQFSDVIFQHLNNASSTKCFEPVPLLAGEIGKSPFFKREFDTHVFLYSLLTEFFQKNIWLKKITSVFAQTVFLLKCKKIEILHTYIPYSIPHMELLVASLQIHANFFEYCHIFT